ncbi:aminopeptidase N [Micrococcus luteus]|uniref:aminopeptidase N n=1 Tax=Micrococcus luteus TaxID=1270 RepID=UPI003681D8DF
MTDTTPDLDATNVTRAEAADRSRLLTVQDYVVDVDLSDARDAATDTYPVRTVIRFACAEPGAQTHLDWIHGGVESVTLNGTALDVAEVVGEARVLLPDLAAQNVVELVGRSVYSRSGEGLHRFTDPADGEVYLYTQYEPADARRVFPDFEQPDLKAAFTFSLTGPEDWVLASNRPEVSRMPAGDGVVRVEFAPTLPQSTYITTLLAGPYAQWEDAWDGHPASGAQAVPLRLFTRRTMADAFDPEAVFDVTKRGLTFFHDLFGVAYPWGKYDQAFVPEYNLGAMENPGLVTFTEDFVFTSRATAVQYEGRANVILHEMAHMWFGDLVTMHWWDDLWLKESFADYMGALGVDEATDFRTAWVTFASRRKAWAYVQDQMPTTHPIVADIVDLEAARQNFDGITYAKGASVLKQLAAYVGRDAFLDAAHRYFAAHAWGNASLADFMAALEAASGRDMRAWADAWLHTSGVPRLRVDVDGDTPALHQEGTDPVTGGSILRPHVLKVGVFTPGQDGVLRRTAQVTADVPGGAGGAAVPLPDLEVPGGVRLVLPNDEDLTYAAVALDAGSLRAALTHPIADPLAEATVWAALWSMTRDGELPVARFLDAVATLSARIATVGVHAQVLAQAAAAVGQYARAEDRDALRARLGEVLAEQTRTLEAGSDRQRTAARTWATLARADVGMAAALEAALLGEDAATSAPGLAIDAELRWLVLQALAATGRAGQGRLDAELEAGRTAQTVTWHRLATAARPEAEVKAAAWEAVMSGRTASGTELSNDLLSATAAGFAAGEVELLAPYESGFWPRLTSVWASRSNGLASRAIGGLFPGRQDAVAGGADAQESHPTLAAAQRWLDEHPDAPGALRRLVVEHTDALRRSLRVQAAQPAG